MNPLPSSFCRAQCGRTLTEAMHGADVFFGLCADSFVILASRTPTVIFASSEIAYHVALARRPDSIVATVA